MINAVVFDWGGVLFGDVPRGFAAAEERFGVPPGTLAGLLGVDPYETDPENLWHRRELGTVSALEYAAWFCARLAAAGGPAIAPEDVLADQHRAIAALAPNENVLLEARSLKERGYQVAVCTNQLAETMELCHSSLADHVFDAVVMSCAVGLRKPDPEMFAHVEAQLGVKPDECVLVDDFAANVAGARAAGWHGLLVTDVDASIAELEALLAQHGRETPATR